MMHCITYNFMSFTEWDTFLRKIICHIRSIREVVIKSCFHMSPIDLHATNHSRINGQCEVYCINRIEKAVENRGLRDLIQEVSIPLETVTEITDNGPKTVERKVFPGYVLVKMVMTDDTWHLVRNIRGATGFVGSGNKAIPLTDEEIAALGVEKREVVVGYQVGDNVKITDGALESFLGTVEEIDLDRSKVRVVVSMFGRETPVELELDQVEPVQD